jgi:hypothetical protein
VADDADRLAGVDEGPDELDRTTVGAQAAGFLVPPGRTRPSKASASASATVRSTANVSPLSSWLKPWIWPAFGAMSSGVAPASCTARQGSVSSTCSTPSVATNAMVFPDRTVDMVILLVVHSSTPDLPPAPTPGPPPPAWSRGGQSRPGLYGR